MADPLSRQNPECLLPLSLRGRPTRGRRTAPGPRRSPNEGHNRRQFSCPASIDGLRGEFGEKSKSAELRVPRGVVYFGKFLGCGSEISDTTSLRVASLELAIIVLT